MVEWRETLSGTFGAVCLVAVGAPLDAVKTRVQTGASKGVLSGFRDVVGRSGVLALWRGSSAALTSAVVENSVVFSANGVFRRLFAGDRNESELTVRDHVFCGALAGVFSSVSIIVPEVIKVRQQAAPDLFRGPLHCAKEIVRVEGVRGLFSGLSALMARDLPFNAIFFGGYSLYSRLLSKAVGGEENIDLGALQHLIAGGGAGATAWAIVFPMDVIKSRLAVNPKSTPMAEIKDIQAKGGLKYLYRGSSAAVVRAFVANAALFVGYEFASKSLGKPRPK